MPGPARFFFMSSSVLLISGSPRHCTSMPVYAALHALHAHLTHRTLPMLVKLSIGPHSNQQVHGGCGLLLTVILMLTTEAAEPLGLMPSKPDLAAYDMTLLLPAMLAGLTGPAPLAASLREG